MIAVDTSSLSAFLGGDSGPDVDLVERSLSEWRVVLPPVVLTEILSAPKLAPAHAAELLQLPLLELKEGYWQRAGGLRARILGRRQKARLADTLIAQVCIDHDLQLVTRDADFARFTVGGLKLLP